MKFNLFKKTQPEASQKSLVLMYHRIASLDSDVWGVAVSPENFEQQIKILQQKMNIVSLQELIDTAHRKGNMAALTFDDGYIDNFEVAKPILEQYQIPATFFITSKQKETEQEYWWDTLENCLLLTEQLPPVFELPDDDYPLIFDLKNEDLLTAQLKQTHRTWKACTEPPPTMRATLFFTIWQHLKSLPHTEQQHHLKKIKHWAGVSEVVNAAYRTMSTSELIGLAGNRLFTIGAHTVTHPALGQLAADFQKREMIENRQYLQQIINKDIDYLAYPYGSFNSDTLMTAWKLGFKAAFTTEERVFDGSKIYQLGRFQVKNITGKEFEYSLNKWRGHEPTNISVGL